MAKIGYWSNFRKELLSLLSLLSEVCKLFVDFHYSVTMIIESDNFCNWKKITEVFELETFFDLKMRNRVFNKASQNNFIEKFDIFEKKSRRFRARSNRIIIARKNISEDVFIFNILINQI